MANPLPHIFQQLSVQGPMSDLDDNFNALIGNVQSGAYMLAQDIGSANAYAATITPAPVAYQAGMIIVLQNIIAANTGASTFNLNGLGALPILKSANNALTGGEVIPGSLAVLVLNGTSAWHLIYASANFNPGPNSVFSSGSQFYGASTFDTMPSLNGSPIIEFGNNSNGSWIKYSSGVVICYMYLNVWSPTPGLSGPYTPGLPISVSASSAVVMVTKGGGSNNYSYYAAAEIAPAGTSLNVYINSSDTAARLEAFNFIVIGSAA